MFAFGRGMAEHGEAHFGRDQVTLTLAGREFAVREEGDRLVLRDGDGDELLAAEPGRKDRLRIGAHELQLPGKKPGRLGDAAELKVQNGIVVAELRAELAPLHALFALAVVVRRLKLAEPREQRPDWNPAAQDGFNLGVHGGY